MKLNNVAYAVKITEYESGWGYRPDGWVLAIDTEQLERKLFEINSHQGAEFSRGSLHTKKLVCLTDEMYGRVVQHGVVWTHLNNIDTFTTAY